MAQGADPAQAGWLAALGHFLAGVDSDCGHSVGPNHYISARLAPPVGIAGKVSPLQDTRFEKARIVGARALQLGMGAPPLVEMDEELRDPVKMALIEYDENAIPLTVKRVTE